MGLALAAKSALYSSISTTTSRESARPMLAPVDINPSRALNSLTVCEWNTIRNLYKPETMVGHYGSLGEEVTTETADFPKCSWYDIVLPGGYRAQMGAASTVARLVTVVLRAIDREGEGSGFFAIEEQGMTYANVEAVSRVHIES